MHHLVYTSTATILLTETELLQLLGPWRATNARLGVTGVLLYSEGQVMQVLEGEAPVVHHLFAAIAGDARHRSVTKLADGPVDGRAFADWSMRFRTVPPADFTQFMRPLTSAPEAIGHLLNLIQVFMAQEPLV